MRLSGHHCGLDTCHLTLSPQSGEEQQEQLLKDLDMR